MTNQYEENLIIQLQLAGRLYKVEKRIGFDPTSYISTSTVGEILLLHQNAK